MPLRFFIISMLVLVFFGQGCFSRSVSTKISSNSATNKTTPDSIKKIEHIPVNAQLKERKEKIAKKQRSTQSPPYTLEIIRSAKNKTNKVALTFDDGPYRSHRQTQRILEILRKQNVKATFFVLGKQAKRFPKLVKQIVKEGHLIANHSWDHPKRQSEEEWITQIEKTQAAIRAAGVKPSIYYRPPHGIVRPEVKNAVSKHKMMIILYTLLSSDWRTPGAKKLTNEVSQRLRPGGIVVLHDGGGDRRQTIKALPEIIRRLKARGLNPVRIDELLDEKKEQDR